MNIPFTGYVFFACIAIEVGCGSAQSNGTSLPHFDDISNAPAAIQTAARAVVRVHSAGSYATGSFISATGLLLTNNHVLGVPVCPVEGCSIQITQMHQHGAPRQNPVNVFAVPVAVDEGLDMAVAQLYVTPRDATGARVTSPDFLALYSHDAGSLLGTHVTIVGHPEGELKKWTDGVVIDATGTWFSTSAFILPGDSGSPVLDDEGRMVGLIHHSAAGQDIIASDGVDEQSIGTASAPLMAAMTAPLPAAMISIAMPTTATALVASDIVYLNGNQSSVMVAGAAADIVSILGQTCDAAIADMTIKTIDALSTSLSSCYDAQQWIECRADAGHPAYATVCPAAADITAWAARYQAMNQRWMAMNDTVDLSTVSFAIASLSPAMAGGVMQGAASLQQALTAAGSVLDFTLANYLAAFQITQYGTNNVIAFTRAYAKLPDYQAFATRILYTVEWLYGNAMLSESDAQSILSQLAGDPAVSVGSKLAIEDYEYNAGWAN